MRQLVCVMYTGKYYEKISGWNLYFSPNFEEIRFFGQDGKYFPILTKKSIFSKFGENYRFLSRIFFWFSPVYLLMLCWVQVWHLYTSYVCLTFILECIAVINHLPNESISRIICWCVLSALCKKTNFLGNPHLAVLPSFLAIPILKSIF